jgi:hypothetical protein
MLRATWAGCGESEDTVTGNETVPPGVVVRYTEPSTIERPVCVFVGDVLEVVELEEEDDDVATVDVVCAVDDVELVEEVVEEDAVVMICWKMAVKVRGASTVY